MTDDVDMPVPVPIPEPEPDDPEQPSIPETATESDLHEAVGARRPSASRDRRPENLDEPPPPKRAPSEADRDDDDDDGPRPDRRRLWFALAAATLVGGTIATFVLLGRSNSDQYEIVCTSDKIIAEQGRTFPPWGMRPMSGPEWKSIELPPNAECEHHETENPADLTTWFEDALEKRARTLLTGEVTKVDLAEQQLNQALLLLRAPAAKNKREVVARLLNDVVYWRASAKLREAATALADAAKQFDTAAGAGTELSHDGAAWANHIRKLADELHAGPQGVQHTFAPLPPIEHADRVAAPPGVALPVESSGSTHVEQPVAPPPDAGVPTGGVLL